MHLKTSEGREAVFQQTGSAGANKKKRVEAPEEREAGC